MGGITLQLEPEFKAEIKYFSWVNWSDIGREEALKKEIFERYIKTGKISDEDWKFCDKIDWHPVDELPLKEEFVEELEKRKKGPFIKLDSVEEIFKE